MSVLKHIAGGWRGTYSYDTTEPLSLPARVPFLLVLDQGWLGRFTGTVVDDCELGLPGTGTVTGRFSYPRIKFTKQMPVGYVRSRDGRRLTLREYLSEHGHVYKAEIAARPIFYQGEFTDAHHADGTWIITAGPIPLPDGRAIRAVESRGTWTLEKSDWP